MYNIVKKFYDKGIYTASDVAKFVAAGKITAAQYETIVAEVYKIN